MSDIRIAESELLTTTECDAEIQNIETRISEINAIPQRSKLAVGKEVQYELDEFVKLLEKCKKVITELKESLLENSKRGHSV